MEGKTKKSVGIFAIEKKDGIVLQQEDLDCV